MNVCPSEGPHTDPHSHACQGPLVVSDSLLPVACSPPARPCPWDSPGKNTGVGCRALPQGRSDPGMDPVSLTPPALAGGSLTTGTTAAGTGPASSQRRGDSAPRPRHREHPAGQEQARCGYRVLPPPLIPQDALRQMPFPPSRGGHWGPESFAGSPELPSWRRAQGGLEASGAGVHGRWADSRSRWRAGSG